MCNEYFSLRKYYSANPNGEDVWQWNANHISKLHDNPTVNKSGIIVLLRQFWVSTGKEKATMQRVFFLAQILFVNSYIENVRNWVLNLVFKFHDDPTVNESRSSFFWNMFGDMREKERVLGGGEGNTKLRGRGGVQSIVSRKTNLRYCYL